LPPSLNDCWNTTFRININIKEELDKPGCLFFQRSDTGNVRVTEATPFLSAAISASIPIKDAGVRGQPISILMNFNSGILLNSVYKVRNFTNGRTTRRRNTVSFGQGFLFFRRYWDKWSFRLRRINISVYQLHVSISLRFFQ